VESISLLYPEIECILNTGKFFELLSIQRLKKKDNSQKVKPDNKVHGHFRAYSLALGYFTFEGRPSKL